MDYSIFSYLSIDLNEGKYFTNNPDQAWRKLFNQGTRLNYLYFSLSPFLVVHMNKKIAFVNGNVRFAPEMPYGLLTIAVPQLIWEKLVEMRQITERKFLQRANITTKGCHSLSSEAVSLHLEEVPAVSPLASKRSRPFVIEP